MGRFVRVAARSEITDGSGHCFEIEGRRIAIFRVGEDYFGLADECTHRGGPLSQGTLEGGEVKCPLHGARFDLRTGEVAGPPARQRVAVYRVRASGDDIEAEL